MVVVHSPTNHLCFATSICAAVKSEPPTTRPGKRFLKTTSAAPTPQPISNKFDVFVIGGFI